MTEEERFSVITTCLEEARKADRYVTIIAGAGSNNTKEAVHLHKKVAALGVDASLQVTPWYNKPTQEGLYTHFKAVADADPLPVVLYNVPGRTGVDLLPETVAKLAKNCPNIVAIKEATGSIQRAQDIINALDGIRDDFTILSGDDGNILPLLAIGGHGVISVISHLCAADLVKMYHAWQERDIQTAQNMSKKVNNLSKLMFFRSNPLPVKHAVVLQNNLPRAIFREPLVPLSADDVQLMSKKLAEEGWI